MLLHSKSPVEIHSGLHIRGTTEILFGLQNWFKIHFANAFETSYLMHSRTSIWFSKFDAKFVLQRHLGHHTGCTAEILLGLQIWCKISFTVCYNSN